MSARYDTDQIRADYPADKVLDRLTTGVKISSGGKSVKAVCPRCNKSGKFDYSLSKDLFNCFGCDLQGGDVIGLVMAVLDKDFMGACEWLGAEKTESEADAKRLEQQRKDREALRRRREQAELKEKRERMESILGDVQGGVGTQAEDYLRVRGLGPALDAMGWPEDILFHAGLEAFCFPAGGPPVPVGKFPAMVGRARNRRNQLVLLHRTFLDGDAPGKAAPKRPDGVSDKDWKDGWSAKQMSGVLSMADTGIYLGRLRSEFDGAPVIALVGEGIESALSPIVAIVMNGEPVRCHIDVYAALSLDRLVGRTEPDANGQDISVAGWTPPGGARKPDCIIIAADNDLAATPQFPEFEEVGDKKMSRERAKVLFGRARGRMIALGYRCRIYWPPFGHDPNSALTAALAADDALPEPKSQNTESEA